MLQSHINLNSLDIQQARIKFILFKSKIRSILYGGTVDESILSPRDNVLGQWLYNTALNKYKYIPEMKDLERLNLTITRLAKELVDQYNRGRIEEARSGLSSLETSEEELIRLLTAIESKSI
jgi:hypothetical protein